MVEVMKIMVTAFKRSHACTATLSTPSQAAGHHWPTPPLETPECSQASLGQTLVGSLLLLLGPGAQGSICALQESISHFCVSSGSSMLGLMVISSKKTYAIPKSAAPRAPVPVAIHCWPVLLQEMLKQFCLSLCGVPGSWCAQDLFEPSEHLWWEWDFILNMNLPILPSCWGFFFALGHRVSPHPHSSEV